MKKLITTAFLTLAVFSLAACGSNKDQKRQQERDLAEANAERTWEGTGAGIEDMEPYESVESDEIQREENRRSSEGVYDIDSQEDSAIDTGIDYDEEVSN